MTVAEKNEMMHVFGDLSSAFREFTGGEEVLLCDLPNGGDLISLFGGDDLDSAFQDALNVSGLNNLTTHSHNRTVPTSFSSSPALFPSSGLIQFEEDSLSALYNHSNILVKTVPTIQKTRGRKPKSAKVELQTTVRPNRLFQIKPRRTRQEMLEQESHSSQAGYEEGDDSKPVQFRQKRSADDQYTPSWVRGHGGKREGLCPHCQPPVWLRIKQSAYWYHLNFFHGVSASTGLPFQDPLKLRLKPHFDHTFDRVCQQIEGLCRQCNQWVLFSTDSVEDVADNVTLSLQFVKDNFNIHAWYKHAQKCKRELAMHD